MAVWNHFLFCMFVHPRSSQEARCVVRPSRAYRESVMHVRGERGLDSWRATTIVASSPVWFD